ncbi:MAG: ATP-binding protein [Lautropia sp.]|nr:ATP-binding protein [Lautropia sp.]
MRHLNSIERGAPAGAGMVDQLQSQIATFWTSLRYLADGRLIISLLLLIYIPVLGPDTVSAPADQRNLFVSLTVFYFVFALLCSVVVRRVRRGFSWQLFLQVTVDVLVLGMIVYASNGRSGLGALMITPVAGVAILSAQLPALGVAAAASMMLLGEVGVRILQRFESMGSTAIGNELMIAAVISATLFFTALVVNRLARRLAMQERLAIRRAEDLRNQRAINALIVAELDQGVIVFDPRGVPRDMNPKARRMLNLPMGVPVSEADPAALEQLRRILGAPDTVAELQIPGAPGAGRIRARVLTGGGSRALRDDLGESPYYLDADNGRDGRALLDRVVLLEDLRRIEDQAQQLKLASMGRLSASIAHEIRNPLGAIRHAGNLLGERVDDPQLKRLTTIIENSTLRIDRIVEDVLSMARRTAMQERLLLTDFFAQFMPEFMAQTQGVNPARISLRIQAEPTITFDPNHLRQILVNLLNNALRYASDAPASVLLWWMVDGEGQAQLWILDDGPGVPEEQRKHLFEPFFTTETRGTGLGLHMTQELCGANGATIHYRSTSTLPAEARQRYGAGFVMTPMRTRSSAPLASGDGR